MFKAAGDHQEIHPSDTISFAFNAPVTGQSGTLPWGNMTMTLHPTDRLSFSTGYHENTQLVGGRWFQRHLENPFINMKKAYDFGTGYALNKKTDIEFGYTHGRNAFFVDEEDSDTYNNRMGAFHASVVYRPAKKWAVTVMGGTLKEKESILGMSGKDAFNVDGSDTYFGGVKIKYMPTDKWTLEGGYWRGLTKAETTGELMRFSDLTSEAFAFNATYAVTDKQQMGFDLFSPLKVVDGYVNIKVPVGRHPTENIAYYDNYQISMADEHREYDMSLFWQNEVHEDWRVRAQMGLRMNPEGRAVSPDYFTLLGLNIKY